MPLLELLGIAALTFGAFFCAVGVLGVIRLPNTLSRLHASGKVATLGVFGLLVGTGLLMPALTFRLIALGLFILLTSPVASHAIAAAVLWRDQTVAELDRAHEAPLPEQQPAYGVTARINRHRFEEILEAQERVRQQRAQQAQKRQD